jgi:hypothetical protein
MLLAGEYGDIELCHNLPRPHQSGMCRVYQKRDGLSGGRHAVVDKVTDPDDWVWRRQSV